MKYFTLFSSNLPPPNMTLSFVIFVIFFPPSLPAVFAQIIHNVKLFQFLFSYKITSIRPKTALLTFPSLNSDFPLTKPPLSLV